MIWPDSIWIINENEVIIMIPWVGFIRLTGYNFVWVRNVCINFGIIEIRRGDRILNGGELIFDAPEVQVGRYNFSSLFFNQ